MSFPNGARAAPTAAGRGQKGPVQEGVRAAEAGAPVDPSVPWFPYSHSMVAGGLGVRSYSTRLSAGSSCKSRPVRA